MNGLDFSHRTSAADRIFSKARFQIKGMRNSRQLLKNAESAHECDERRTFSQAYLINKLNFINFVGDPIIAIFRHVDHDYSTRISVMPLPCKGEELSCCWLSDEETIDDLTAFRLECLLVADEGQMLRVRPHRVSGSSNGFRLCLPEECHPVKPTKRVACFNRQLRAHVYQKGIKFAGRLLSYSVDSHEIAIDLIPPQTSHWIDLESPVYLVLADARETYYSNECRIEAKRKSGNSCYLNLRSDAKPLRRFKPKEHRTRRVTLRPSPDAVFIHPFSRQEKVLKVRDLSGSGFSVILATEDDCLIVGLIIPDVRLELAGERLATCKAQVLYRRLQGAGGSTVICCGLAILDISARGHTMLQKIVQQAENPKAYMSNPISQRALWEFFFETGFIYPEKYDAWEEQKQRIKQIYERLYLEQPQFARHFTYQENGIILGHMAMLRFYSKAWLIHHHAARSSSDESAGLAVLDQICRFINQSYALDTLNLDYIFFFYRPENQFPSGIFGGIARYVNDPSKCSLDRFAYGHFSFADCFAETLPPHWSLAEASAGDLNILKASYDRKAGGLMMAAFDFGPDPDRLGNLSREYEQIGFKRTRLLFSLKKKDMLKVIFEVNVSDVGLNMSDLTSSIRLFLVDTVDLANDLIGTSLNRLAKLFERSEVSLLVYPAEQSAIVPVTIERNYMLWTGDAQYIDRYMTFINKIVHSTRTRS